MLYSNELQGNIEERLIQMPSQIQLYSKGKVTEFREIAAEELKKYLRSVLVKQGALLVDGTPMDTFRSWGKPGIRAQLFHKKERKMLMDFHLEGDSGSLHILNAVSPAFTCALPFAEFVLDEVEARTGGSAPRGEGASA